MMKWASGLGASVVLMAALAACGPGATTKTEKSADVAATAPGPAPARAPFDGCSWEYLSGGGIGLWSQKCSNNRVVVDAARQAAFMELTVDGQTSRGEIARVFAIPEGGLPALAQTLVREGAGPTGSQCTLEAVAATTDIPQGVARYTLVPTGQTKTAWDRAVASDTAPETPPCGAYGVAIVGDRYIEVQAAHPDRALFVELGSEMSIYEPSTIAFVDAGHGGESAKAKPGGGH